SRSCHPGLITPHLTVWRTAAVPRRRRDIEYDRVPRWISLVAMALMLSPCVAIVTLGLVVALPGAGVPVRTFILIFLVLLILAVIAVHRWLYGRRPRRD